MKTNKIGKYSLNCVINEQSRQKYNKIVKKCPKMSILILINIKRIFSLLNKHIDSEQWWKNSKNNEAFVLYCSVKRKIKWKTQVRTNVKWDTIQYWNYNFQSFHFFTILDKMVYEVHKDCKNTRGRGQWCTQKGITGPVPENCLNMF